MKQFEFYSEDGALDYRTTITKTDKGQVFIEIQHCGRDRASVWSDVELFESDKGFYETVQEEISYWGGWNEISAFRIGQKEYW